MVQASQALSVHSFQTLLLNLATIAKNTVVLNIGGLDSQEEPPFKRVTTPTPLQQRFFELLSAALK